MGFLRFNDNQPDYLSQGRLVVPPLVDVFIETGTNYGNTLMNAANTFAECHSIESHYLTYLAAVQRFRHTNAKVYYGSSPNLLSHIIDPAKSTLFWLDAHHHDQETDEYGQCPLLFELNIIASTQWESPVYILIDDAYYFMEEFWTMPGRDVSHRNDWPTSDQIKEKLPGHRVELVEQLSILMCTPNWA